MLHDSVQYKVPIGIDIDITSEPDTPAVVQQRRLMWPDKRANRHARRATLFSWHVRRKRLLSDSHK